MTPGVASRKRSTQEGAAVKHRPSVADGPKRELPWSLALGAVIVIATVLAYLPAMQAGFIWDDDAHISANRTLRAPGGLGRIWFQIGATQQYYPMVFTSFWMEWRLWGADPLGYHVVNVLLHAASALTLMGILRLLRVPGAAAAALVFALHPVHVESVAWCTERKNILSGLFYLTSALAYLKFAGLRAPSAAGVGKTRWSWYVLSLLLFLCAMLSKTVACSLPVGLVLVLWWRQGALSRRNWLTLAPMLAIGAAMGLLTAWIERKQIGAVGPEWELSFLQRCLIAGRALWFYIGKLLWPQDLTFIYPRWNVDAGVWWQYLFPLAFLGLVAALWIARRRLGKGPLVAVLYFAAALFPALGFFNVYPMRYSFVADHFQYLASIGMIVLGVGMLARAQRRRLPRGRPLAVGAGAVACALLALVTWQRGGAFRDPEALWKDTIDRNPRCWMAYQNLGVLYRRQGNVQAALRAQEQAVSINPNDSTLLNDYGVTLAAANDDARAMDMYRRALELKPSNVVARTNLGNALLRLNRTDQAIEQYNLALAAQADYPQALNQLAFVRVGEGKKDQAIELYFRSLRAEHEQPQVHFNLGVLLAERGRLDEAIRHLTTALQLKPDYQKARDHLDRVRKQRENR